MTQQQKKPRIGMFILATAVWFGAAYLFTAALPPGFSHSLQHQLLGFAVGFGAECLIALSTLRT